MDDNNDPLSLASLLQAAGDWTGGRTAAGMAALLAVGLGLAQTALSVAGPWFQVLVVPLAALAALMVAVAPPQRAMAAGMPPLARLGWTDVHTVVCLRLLATAGTAVLAMLPFAFIAAVLAAVAAGLVATATRGEWILRGDLIVGTGLAAIALGMFYVSARLLPWTAAAVDGYRTTFRESVAWTSNYGRRLFAATALVLAPATAAAVGLFVAADALGGLTLAAVLRVAAHLILILTLVALLAMHRRAHARLRQLLGGNDTPYFMM